MKFTSKKQIQELKNRYPAGTRLKCLYMKESFHPVPYGTLGTVEHVDDLGQIHVHWDNGSGLALQYGVDAFDVLYKD